MSKKRMLADVLWEAANVMLPDGVSYSHEKNQSEYSCDACYAVRREWDLSFGSFKDIERFVESLGLPDPCNNYGAFDDFDEGEQRQGVRYMWLLLAMHVAEDEGIEV